MLTIHRWITFTPRMRRLFVAVILPIFITSFLISSLFLTPDARASQVTLAWDANTEPNLAGYRISYGTTSGQYSSWVDVAKSTSCVISSLQPGVTYFFAATAYNTAGDESAFSSEIYYAVPVPQNTTVEILWRNSTTGQNWIWYMNGSTFLGAAQLFTVDAQWQIVGRADFNGDGKQDILWRNPTTGATWVWYMDGTSFVGSAQLQTIPAPWEIVGVADFNGDGKPDILWRNSTTGENYVWYMNGTKYLGNAQLQTIPPPWQIAGVGDFNGDGKPDILWRNPSTGGNWIWYMNGTTYLGNAQLQTITDANWTIVALRDFNQDGQIDILWRNTSTGEDVVWYMNGATRIGTGNIATANAAWQVVGH